MDPIHIISLGAGVQSSTLLLMAEKGLITPRPRFAIFADTQGESKATYAWLTYLQTLTTIPIHIVSRGNLAKFSTEIIVNQKTGNGYFNGYLPAFTKRPNGKRGMIGRRCTTQYKIKPLQKAIRRLCGVPRGCKTHWVTQWIGISHDEALRQKCNPHKWVVNRWPLLELQLNRTQCLSWLHEHGYPSPPRSSCIYCPYKSDREWAHLKETEPESFAEAARLEKVLQASMATIQKRGNPHVPFLHRKLIPLDQVKFNPQASDQDMSLIYRECHGMCGN